MKLRFTMALLAVLCLALASTAFAQGVIFNDGPTNGQVNSLFIDGPNPGGPYGQSISDGFTATGSGAATSMTFGEWVLGSATPTTVTWWLGTSAFAGDIATGTASGSNLSYNFLTSNSYGYSVYNVTVTGLSGNFTAGNTYYLSLGNANDSSGSHYDGWDVNSGPASCSFSQGGVDYGDCGLGSPEGEAFTLNSGGGGGTVPEPSSLLLLGTGVVGLAGLIRRRIGL